MKKLLRSLLAGGAATFADLLVLLLAIHVLHLDARIASIPALVAGGVVSFFGNRHFAFRAGAGDVRKQAFLYTATEVVALVLNGLLYDVAVRALHPTAFGVVLTRLLTQNAVFLLWSFPLWRHVFRVAPQRREA
ncbi:MAG: GtrA family protein [Polyangiales bacterium]